MGQSKYVTTFDLLKGYWQVPLTERAREISAFVTPDGLYQYKVMPFGMRNAPATFQRLINTVIADIPGYEGYIDDVIIYSEVWTDHWRQIQLFFDKLRDANLTVNLSKSAFGHTQVHFLGHVVGGGEVKPITAKVDAINNFPVPSNKKELMRFLGMAGYTDDFVRIFQLLSSHLQTYCTRTRSLTGWKSARLHLRKSRPC